MRFRGRSSVSRLDNGAHGRMTAAGTNRFARAALLYSVLIILIVALTEGGAWLTARFLASRGILYVAQEISDYPRYMTERDPVLGWPLASEFGRGNYDGSGSRVIPAFPQIGNACVSLYGDSFTWGDGVDNEHAWSNLLSQRLNCRVANYGVPGYGSDQAFLRFLRQPEDAAPIVIFGYLSENILRNVNRLRGLLYPGTVYGLKPRFVLESEGALKLIPLPEFGEDEFRKVVAHPERYLPHEYFLPGGSSGVAHFKFPFTLSVLRAVGNFHLHSELRGEPWYSEFYELHHPSRGLEVTAAILRAFHDTALERGQRPVIIMIPTGLDLVYHAQHGTWTYQRLMDWLAANGVEAFNLGEAIADYLGSRHPCELFRECSGHFNEEGNAALAQAVFNHLSGLSSAASRRRNTASSGTKQRKAGRSTDR